MLQGRMVRLRANEPADGARARRWLSDPDVARPHGERYASAPGDDLWLGPGPTNAYHGVRLAIETNEGDHIGGVSLTEVQPEDRKGALRVLFADPARWSDGHGADVIETALRFAFHDMNLHRVWLKTVDDDEAAIACYRACGFRDEARLRQEGYGRGRYRDLLVMAILRHEFDAIDARRNGGGEGAGHAGG